MRDPFFNLCSPTALLGFKMSGCCEDKLSRLRGYVPFLEKMISKLCRAQDPAKDPQLQKMKSLLAILTQPQKKLKMDTLDKCEQVLQKLYEKVEGGPLQPLRKPESSSSASTPRSPSPSPSPRSPSPPTQKRTPSATSRTSDHNRVKPMTHVEPWSNRPQPRPNSPSQGPWNPGGAPFQRPPQGGPPHFNNGPWREGRGPRFNNDFHPGGPRFGGGPPSRFGGGPQPFQRGGFGMGPRGMGPGGPPFNHGGFQVHFSLTLTAKFFFNSLIFHLGRPTPVWSSRARTQSRSRAVSFK